MNNILWRMIAILHGFFIVVNVLSMIILPFTQSIWVWVPLVSFLLNLMFNNAFKDCPITRFESYIRVKAGYPPLKSFLGHYLFGPIRRIRRKII